VSEERKASLERFEERYKSWGRRPSTIPPGAAAARILARIRPGRPGSRRAWRLAWAAAVVTAVVGSWIVGGRTGHAPPPSPLAVDEAVALPDNVMLWWLDSETPVYFVIRPAEPGEGGR
jgi:hypothetical protein